MRVALADCLPGVALANEQARKADAAKELAAKQAREKAKSEKEAAYYDDFAGPSVVVQPRPRNWSTVVRLRMAHIAVRSAMVAAHLCCPSHPVAEL